MGWGRGVEVSVWRGGGEDVYGGEEVRVWRGGVRR